MLQSDVYALKSGREAFDCQVTPLASTRLLHFGKTQICLLDQRYIDVTSSLQSILDKDHRCVQRLQIS